MTCASCGYREVGSGTYCPRCRSPQKPICPKGHTSSKPGSRFCVECSEPIAVHPAAPLPFVDCLARILSWAVAIGLLVMAAYVIRHITGAQVFWFLGVFGITQVGLERCVLWLVVIPGIVAAWSFFLPDEMGASIRHGIIWALKTIFGMAWKLICNLCRAIWWLAESAGDHGETGAR